MVTTLWHGCVEIDEQHIGGNKPIPYNILGERVLLYPLAIVQFTDDSDEEMIPKCGKPTYLMQVVDPGWN